MTMNRLLQLGSLIIYLNLEAADISYFAAVSAFSAAHSKGLRHVHAFRRSRRRHRLPDNQPFATVLQLSKEDITPADKDQKSREEVNDDDLPETLQREVDAMMEPPGGSSDTFSSVASRLEENRDEFYNPVPVFTGVIFSIASLAIMGYLAYAGITGDDPLTGHPLQ